ncbi:hypothetical protein GCM10028777_22640 [Angustibacter speluncae]
MTSGPYAGWAPPPPHDPWQVPGAPPPRGSRTGLVVGLVVGGAVLLVLLLVGALAAVGWWISRQDGGSVGAPASACDAVVRDEGEGISSHVGPGTNQPEVTRVPYEVVPPATGPHFASPVYPAAPFYAGAERPPLEQLVHNLEHGYTLVWFSSDLPEEQREQLREVAADLRESSSTGGKLVVVEWDDTYGPLPDDRPVVLTHWTADGGVRQACSAASGDALTAFVAQFPFTDSPEPNAP